MTFLGFAFLAALPLVGLPVVLHFFDRRRRVTIEWGAMEFLRAASIRRSRRRNLQQWLLLLARMVALAALILALAQPLAPGRWWGSGAVTETIVVLDNSASMIRSVGGRTLYESALLRIEEELKERDRQDFVRVLFTSPGPEWLDPIARRIGKNKGRVLERLGERAPMPGGGDLLSCMYAASQAEPPASVVQRRILIISDRQSTDWQLADQRSWLRLRETLQTAPVETTVELVSATDSLADMDNIAVTEIQARATRIGLDQTYQVTATVQSYSEDATENLQVTWSVDGEPLGTDSIELLEPGESQDLEWTGTLNEVGTRVITCSIQTDDSLAIDNDNSLIVEVVQGLPILVVENSPSYAEVQSDSWFIEAALGRAAAESEWTSVFQPTLIQAKELPDAPLGEFRAIVLPALTQLSPESIERLAEFVRLGGGLWVAVGPRTDISAFNQFWYRETDGLVPLELDRVVTTVAIDAEHPTGINPLLDDHPATRGLADVQRLDLGNVELTKRHRFSTNEHTTYSTLLEMVNGEPLAVETTYGRGRVILLGVPLRLQFSRLVLSRSFVVMVQQWLGWLTEPAGVQLNLESGDSLVLTLGDDNPLGTDGVLTDPVGKETPIEANEAHLGPAYTLRPRIPGTYTIRQNGSDKTFTFHVARPSAESDLRTLDKDDSRFLADNGAISSMAAQASAPVLGALYRRPLWPLLLGTLLCVIVLELAMSVAMSLQRSRSPVVLRGYRPSSTDVVRTERVA